MMTDPRKGPLGFVISEEKKTDDQFRTSYGVGHHWRPGYWFPDGSDAQAPFYRKLPPLLTEPDRFIPPPETNYKASFDNKFPNPTSSEYGNDHGIHGKPQPHWKVNYIKDFVEKLNGSNFRRPLTFGNRISETHEKFQAHKQPESNADLSHLASFNKILEQNNDPNKRNVSGQINPGLDGQQFYIRDGDVFNLNNPYVTTTNRTHRAFRPDEIDFVRGIGAASAPPRAQLEAITQRPPERYKNEPMRDTMEFPSASKIGPVRHVPRAVPHSGLTTEVRSKFNWPSHPRMRENYYSDVDCHCELPNGVADQSSFLAPATYNTEYQNIGSRRVAVV